MNQQEYRGVPRRTVPPPAPPPLPSAGGPPSVPLPPLHHQPQHLSAFEYVTHRIVEVMRTEDEGKRPNNSDAPSAAAGTPPPPLATYTYPFSALNVAGLVAGSGATSQPSDAAISEPSRPPPLLPPQEPKPLMSSQYEPLSDED